MNEADGKRGNVIWADKADNDAVADYIGALISLSANPCLAVPGGSTPFPIFETLSRRPLPWSNVTLMLTDDRQVPEDHPASNQGKLLAAFEGTSASVIALNPGMEVPTFDLVWLGMGADGHIASLFPNMDPKVDGAPAVVETLPDPLPPEAPFARVSLNMAALVQTKEIILVLRGDEKKQVLDAAIEGSSDLPISRLIAAARCPITIFWSRS